MSERLFGTDGIRGIANIYPTTVEMALAVGRAAGHLFQQEKRTHTILIGKDTRLSGYMFENALTAGLCSMGVNVLLVGPLPTPGVSYIMRSLRCDAGIMISASHNPFQYNGIKFFGPDGFKIPDDMEDAIARLVTTHAIDDIRPTAEQIGTARRIDDAVGRYIEFAKASFPKGMRLDGLKIVCDCANGASYKVGPNALSELGAHVIPIGCQPNGRNINEDCGSMHPENMRATVIRERADVGIAFDGDGDRILMADEEGQLLDGNGLLAVLAVDLLERNALPQNAVVTTIMANGGLQNTLAAYGGKVIWTNVGDRWVVETMREKGICLGGEPSGHMVLLEYNTTGDALIAALQVLATMIRKDLPLSALASAYHALPEAHAAVPLNGKKLPEKTALNQIQVEHEAEMNGAGRVVIRPSGTEPVIRVMVQHESHRTAEMVLKNIVEKVSAL
ncbi:MAG TPA: phosphoglucosamine mutase [Candidatus Hydrogenedentes bacterium]|nr:phosphoglucosamine mutase [Candidatus Hydrogenedentota bacterium]